MSSHSLDWLIWSLAYIVMGVGIPVALWWVISEAILLTRHLRHGKKKDERWRSG